MGEARVKLLYASVKIVKRSGKPSATRQITIQLKKVQQLTVQAFFTSVSCVLPSCTRDLGRVK